jgi:hypothetical protein
MAQGYNHLPRRYRSPPNFILASIVGGLAVIGGGLIFYIGGNHGRGIFLMLCGPVGWALLSGVVALSRRRVTAGSTDSEGGTQARALNPSSTEMSSIGTQKWTGGLNVPVSLGRVSATFPIGSLELTGATLVFRIRPRWASSFLGARVLTVTPSDGALIFPVHQLAGIGIGIRPVGEAAWYFRTRAADEILPVLSSAGFEVSSSLGKWGR